LLDIILVGGSGPYEGNVYATNPETNVFGPVCDDTWDLADVRASDIRVVFMDLNLI